MTTKRRPRTRAPGIEAESVVLRLLMAAVRKAGGRVVLTGEEVYDAGTLGMAFDPTLKRSRKMQRGQKFILTCKP